MRRRRDAGRAMDINAHVTRRTDLRLARVQAHAHAHADAVGPGLGGQRALRLDHGLEGIRGAREGHEERVAVGADHAPMMLLKRLEQKLVLLRQHGGIFLAQLLQEPRRAFDIGEEERDCAGREIFFTHCGYVRLAWSRHRSMACPF